MKIQRTLWSLLLGLALSACGNEELRRLSPGSSSEGNSADQMQDEGGHEDHGEQAFDEIVEPPKEYYDALFADTLAKMDDRESFKLQGTIQVLWLNFDGATVTRGFGRGQSFILCKSQATIPAPELSPADREAIVDLVQAFYDEAQAALVITQEKPSAGDFTTIHVGGSYIDLGCPGTGVLGVAPFDRGNANPNDVGFAFTRNVRDVKVIAETIAHEAGHSFGLDHITNSRGLMFASSSPAIEGFRSGRVQGSTRIQDSPAELRKVLGQNAAGGAAIVLPTVAANGASPIAGLSNLPIDLANLPGLSQIAGIASLLPGLDPTQLLDISTILPQLTTLLPALGGNLPGLDKILTIVAVAGTNGSNAANGGAVVPFDIAKAALVLGGLVLSGGTLDLAGLAGLVGAGALDQLLDLAQGFLGGLLGIGNGNGGGSPPSPSSIGNLPDLASLLGLVGAPGIPLDPASLINSLVGTTRVVNANFQGQDREALLSLLKVAYTQAYRSTNGN